MKHPTIKQWLGGLLCAACLLGIGVRHGIGATAQAQAGAPAQAQAPPKAEPGKGVVFTMEEIKKRFVRPDKTGGQQNIITDSYYRLAVQRRPYYEPARMTTYSKVSSHFDDAEMHDAFTQLYFIVDGTGAIVLGGKPPMELVDDRFHQHMGGPTLEGAKTFRVKAGDWVVIPPLTWHQTQADPGQVLVFGLMNINKPKGVD